MLFLFLQIRFIYHHNSRFYFLPLAKAIIKGKFIPLNAFIINQVRTNLKLTKIFIQETRKKPRQYTKSRIKKLIKINQEQINQKQMNSGTDKLLQLGFIFIKHGVTYSTLLNRKIKFFKYVNTSLYACPNVHKLGKYLKIYQYSKMLAVFISKQLD